VTETDPVSEPRPPVISSGAVLNGKVHNHARRLWETEIGEARLATLPTAGTILPGEVAPLLLTAIDR
jgi:hypothetical protein